MLPDWPELKGKLQERLREFFLERRAHHLGSFAQSPQYTIFEGGDTETVRSSGEREVTETESFSAEFSLSSHELTKLNLSSLLQKIDKMAEQMAGSMKEHSYQVISDSCEKHGNVVNSSDRKLTPEAFLESFEKLEIDFSRDGVAKMPEIHISLPEGESLETFLGELKNNKLVEERMAELMESKRREWRAREADRVLVG